MPTPNPPAKDYLFNQIADLQTRVKNLEQQPKAQTNAKTYNGTTTTSSPLANNGSAGAISVSATIGASTNAIVTVLATISMSSTGTIPYGGWIGATVTNPSGSTTTLSTVYAVYESPASVATGFSSPCSSILVNGLTPGANTFTMTFAAYGGITVNFQNPTIIVQPL
jgi:hypothetical protein